MGLDRYLYGLEVSFDLFGESQVLMCGMKGPMIGPISQLSYPRTLTQRIYTEVPMIIGNNSYHS